MSEEKVGIIAICVIRHGDRIFVAEGHDPVKGETFYRPLGGHIEFGEYGARTVERELEEEVGERITNVRYKGLSENIYTYLGEAGHEIVLVFEGEFADEAMYEKGEVIAQEGDDQFKAVWKPLSDFVEGKYPLYPDGLFEMLV